MKITNVEATVHAAASKAPLIEGKIEDYRGGPPRPFVVCRVETDAGVTGHGFTGRFLARQVANALNGEIRALVTGMDAGQPAAAQTRIRETLNPRGMTGVAASAASALDIACWDIRGRAEGKSIAEMLGGAHASAPVYLTFGMPQYDRAQLAEAARLGIADGYTLLKMVVAVDPGGWREDAARVHAVCDAIGNEAELIIDANEGFDAQQARSLAQEISGRHISWFEEPIENNDPVELARFRDDTGMRVGAGQMEADPRFFSALLDTGAVDILQPNVLYCGGFTGGASIARLADARSVRIANGAGWPLVNMHLMAGVPNGWLLEHHVAQSGIEDTLFVDPPSPVDGRLVIPEKFGLGLEIDRGGLEETRLDQE